MRRYTLTLFATSIVILLTSTDVAWAGATSQYWLDDGGVGSGVGTDRTSGGSDGSGGGSSRPLSCGYSPVDTLDAELANHLAQQGALAGGQGEGLWYQQLCTDPDGNIVISNVIWVTTSDPKALAQQAFRYATLPTLSIALNPSPDHDQIVNLPTWLWLSTNTWQPVSASASAGGLTATTTATPSSVVWNTGDGEQLSCNGPGTPYDSTKPESTQHTDCAHIFRRSSTSAPNGHFTITATVQWHVTWTATGAAPGATSAGDLGTINRSVTTTVRVTEVQALNRVT